MKRILSGVVALVIAVMSVAVTPASAQSRHHGLQPYHKSEKWDRKGPPPGWNKRSWDQRRSYLRKHGHRDDDNDAAIGAIAGAILGFALGAAVVDSQANQRQAVSRLDDRDWIAYCARKYRTFDARTGTYMGYDGLRHYCQ